jgi:hypothetical protein
VWCCMSTMRQPFISYLVSSSSTWWSWSKS